MKISSPLLIRITTVPVSLEKLLTGQMSFMKERGFNVIAVSSEGPEIGKIKENEGIEHHVIKMTRNISPMHDLKALVKLFKFFRKCRPDIIHSHTPKAGLLGMLAAKMARVPIRIHTVAGLPVMTASGLTRLVLMFTEKITSLAATHIWPNSASLMKYMKENNLASQAKLEIIGEGSSNGIDISYFQGKAEESLESNHIAWFEELPEDATVFISIGRLVRDKGILELINAFDVISASYDQAFLLVLGDWETVRKSETIPINIRRKLIDNKKIYAPGYVANVAPYLKRSSVLIHASHREGFPNTILQAHALAIPVISSIIPGNVDATKNGKYATCFEVGNTSQLIENMKYCLENPKKMKKVAILANEWCENTFDRHKIHENIAKRYDQYLQMSLNLHIDN